MSLNEFLLYATGLGVIGIVSFLFEEWKWYQSLSNPKMKQLIFFGACAVIALGSQAIYTYVPSNILDSIAPWFGTGAALFAYIFFGTEFHNKTKLDK